MLPLWPRFHDPSYAPSWREQVALHWRANLLMLRSPRAIALFCAIAFVPVVLFLGAWWLFWSLVEADALLARRGPILLLSLAAVLLFLTAQHLAFVQAMNRTYGPFVRIALRARGTPICLGCGQLLAANADRCPECGAVAALGPRGDARDKAHGGDCAEGPSVQPDAVTDSDSGLRPGR